MSNGTLLALGSVTALAVTGTALARGSKGGSENTADPKHPGALQQLRRTLHASTPGQEPLVSGSADRTKKRTRTGASSDASSDTLAPHRPTRPTVGALRAVADAFLKVDPREASDTDLVAVLLAGGTTGDPLSAAADLLHDLQGNLARVGRAEGLLSRAGFEPMSRARLLASAELARRASLIGAIEGMGAPVQSVWDAEKLARTLASGTTEKLVGIYLDRRLRLIGFRILSVGNVSMTIVDPLEVFRPALEMHAAAIILVHNHPSGDGIASREDDAITRRIAEGCATLGLSLLDHLVLGRAGSSTSYAQTRPHIMKASPTSPLFTAN